MWKICFLQFHLQKLRKIDVKGRKFINFVFAFLLFAGLGLAVFTIALYISRPFVQLKIGHNYLTVLLGLWMLLSTLNLVSEVNKNFYADRYQMIYSRLPLAQWKIDGGKLIALAAKQFGLTVIFLIFTAVPFAINSKFGIGFYVKLGFINIILTLVPLVFAIILGIPAFYIIAIAKRHPLLSVLVIIGALALAYIAYYSGIKVIISIIESTGGYISPEKQERLRQSTRLLHYSSFLSSLILQAGAGRYALAMVINLLVVAALVSAASPVLLFFKRFAQKYRYGLAREYKFHRPTQRSQTVTLLIKEAKMILRNSDYSFQVLALNALLPMFVIATTQVASKIGISLAGAQITAGIGLFSGLMFIIITNSFQSNLISSDRQAHYIMKIVPYNYLKYVFVKLIWPLSATTLALIVNAIFLVAFKFLTPAQGIVIFLITIAFSVGYSCFSVAMDYKNPEYLSGRGQHLNFLVNLFWGLLVALSLGLALIALPFFTDQAHAFYLPLWATYLLICLGVSFYAGGGVLHLYLVIRRRPK